MVPSVLIVDDEKHTREGLQQALQENYDVSVAGSTDEAFNLMEAQEFNVILTDLRMPGVDGLDMVRRFRSVDGTKQVPIIVLSAQEEAVIKAQLFEAGANDYITKPFHAQELRARLRALPSNHRRRRVCEHELARLSFKLRTKARLAPIEFSAKPSDSGR